jgi:hypothetical protein
MKNNLFVLTILLAGTMLLSGFTTKKAEETGGIAVQIAFTDGATDLQGSTVYLATSLENIEAMEYVQVKGTDKNGLADFGQKPAGNYVIDGLVTLANAEGVYIDYTAAAIVPAVVVAGKNTVVKLTLTPRSAE